MARTSKTQTATSRKRTPKANADTMKVCPFLRAIGADEFEFPATSEFFYKDKTTKDGLAVWSKAGERLYNKGYRARKNLAGAIEATSGLKKGTKAHKEAMVKVNEAQAIVDDLAAQGVYKYGRVKREHGAALQVA